MNAQKFQLKQEVTITQTFRGETIKLPATIVEVRKGSVVVSYMREGVWLIERIKTS